MTCYLAPEYPRPSSVTSEYYFRRLNGFPMIDEDQRKCLFGEEYEREFCFYLAKHTEANCDDRVCLIGEEAGWLIPIQERLFLNKPIYFIDCNLHQNMIEQQLSSNKFDRIILFNCLHKIKSASISPVCLLQKSLTNDGKLIIISREPYINTLPLPAEVVTKWMHVYGHSARLIEQIYHEKRMNIEIYQNIETIKFMMKKLHWFRLLYNRMFYPLTLIHQKQIIDGLRQLNETYFKYHPGLVEIHDRLTFLTIHKILPRSIQSSNNPIRRFDQKLLANRIWNSQISITDEITQLFNLRKQNN